MSIPLFSSLVDYEGLQMRINIGIKKNLTLNSFANIILRKYAPNLFIQHFKTLEVNNSCSV